MLVSVTNARSDFTAMPFQWASLCMQRRLILFGSFRRRETVGYALRTVGSLRVTKEICINKPFSSEAQSGEHTNSLCSKAQCVCVHETPRDPLSNVFAQRDNKHCKSFTMRGEKAVYVQRCTSSPCWCLNRLFSHIVIPAGCNSEYVANKHRRHRHITTSIPATSNQHQRSTTKTSWFSRSFKSKFEFSPA